MRRSVAIMTIVFGALPVASNAGEPVPVLVELFTSEGCSSCPPADAALERLGRTQPVAGARIIPLEFHVDYWNDLGWADPFSSAQFSRRQAEYARGKDENQVYTPQMVVDGTQAFVGEEKNAIRAVQRAVHETKRRINLELKGTTATVAVEGAPEETVGIIWLAVTENGRETAVPRGENAGKTLRHSAVVRLLKEVGPASSGPHSIEVGRVKSRDTGQLNLVTWVQDPSTLRVLALTSRPAGL